MIKVNPRAKRHPDRGGDPLDGLVNLFDLGIVLSVAFLLAALSSLNLTEALTDKGLQPAEPQVIEVSPGEEIHELPEPGAQVVGEGERVGAVYQLPDGRLVYVTENRAPDASAPDGP